jgi:hypothetical protein
MNKILSWKCVFVIVIASSVSCSTFTSSKLSGPVEDRTISPEAFLQPYQEAWRRLESKTTGIDEQEMIHLGLPTTNSVTIWYALAKGVPRINALDVLQLNDGDHQEMVPKGTLLHVFNQTHQVGRIEISKLAAGSTYRFVLRGGGLRSPRHIVASTKPITNDAFSFVAGSCFQPWHVGPGDQTYLAEETASLLRAFKQRALARQRGENGPSFYLGLGDQIYVDPGAGDAARISYLYGKHSERMRGSLDATPNVLRSLYRYHLGLRPMDEALSGIPSAMMWDDHDIRDGWGSQRDEDGPGWQRYYSYAREAFVAFQAARNPVYQTSAAPDIWEDITGISQSSEGLTIKTNLGRGFDFAFTWGAAEFFVADGRSERNFREARGMSHEQLNKVDEWLRQLALKRDEPRLLVFCFPVPLAGGYAITGKLAARMPLEGRDDAAERPYILAEEWSRLLNALYGHVRANRKHRLLILSGDVHYSGIQILRDANDSSVLGYEIVSSGLAQSKFNHQGPFWLTVGRVEHGVILENRGYYAGPCFVEIFVSAGDLITAPKTKILFYPAAERPSKIHDSRLREFTTLNLNVSNIGPEFALAPEDYPPNKPLPNFIPGRQRTKSVLAEFLILDRWIGSGRAQRGPPPISEATNW